MTPLFKKLNWKDQDEILVLNAPASLEPELASIEGVRIRRDPAEVEAVAFALGFATTQGELDAAAGAILPKTQGDAVVWLAYPKKSSKRYRCDFDRDTGWEALGNAGFEAVRQVAIDEDWSALRFRRVEFIRKMTRDPSRAGSAAGRARTQGTPLRDG